MPKLRAFWDDVLASYWFLPALFAIAAVFLAVLTIWLDRNGWADWLSTMEWLIPARPDGASNMLTVIASSMIGVASTVFSITIAAVAFASANYGPRILTNFMEDRGNQFALATFIGTFVYSLTILRTVRQGDEPTAYILGNGETAFPGFVPQLSLLTAYALTGLSVAVLVFFLNHIPASIRINSVLSRIGRRLLKMIDTRFPDANTGATAERHEGGLPIIARGTGYIQIIDYERLHEKARKIGGRLMMRVRTGDFIHPELVVASWLPDEDEASDAGDPPEEMDLEDSLALGDRRTPSQDVDFLIDELVEIALRALSPGINDPFTAITAVHWLGAATAKLAARDLQLPRVNGEKNRVIPLEDDFDYYIARGFGAMRAGFAGNRIAALRFLAALGDATTTLRDASRSARIRQEAELLIAQSRLELQGPELDQVEARYALLTKQLDEQELSGTQ